MNSAIRAELVLFRRRPALANHADQKNLASRPDGAMELTKRLYRGDFGGLTLMRELCHRHGYAACLALALFVTSSVFVQGFAKLAVLEYGAESAGVAAACRWDCNWYRRIIDDGYNLEPYHNLKSHPKNDAANWPFFPAHPIFAELLSVISGADTKLSLVLTSKFFMLVAIFVFITFAGEVVGPDARPLAGVVLAFNPYLIYAHAGYTEPLYFLLTTMAFRALRRDSWVSAGVFGGILSATRLVGSLFAVSYAVAVGRVGLVTLRRSWPTYLLGLLICPLGLALFMVYLYFLVGDALAFMHIQVAWNRMFRNPLDVLAAGLQSDGWERYFALTAIAAMLMTLWLAKRGQYAYSIFLLGAVLAPLSTGLEATPRFVFWQMPFLLGLVEILSKSDFLKFIYLAFSAAIGGAVVISWFVGKAFVT